LADWVEKLNMAVETKFYIKLPDGSQGPLIATNYVRVVKGGRGNYVEFLAGHLIQTEFEIKPEEEYRFSKGQNGGTNWRDIVFYGWLQSKIGHRKLYKQFKTVSYADYKVGRYYMSPNDLIFEGDLYHE
jgi:hypothetical protein